MRIRDLKNSDPVSTSRICNTDCMLNFLQYMYLEDSLGSCVGGASIPWSWASWGRRQRRRLAWTTLILLTLILAWGAVVLQLLTQQLQSINSKHGTWCKVKSARTMMMNDQFQQCLLKTQRDPSAARLNKTEMEYQEVGVPQGYHTRNQKIPERS